MENCILWDWFSVTSKVDSPQSLIEWLGLQSLEWETVKGQHGYHDRLYAGGISIHFNGRDDMGVWLEMSGQGCRTFESFGHGQWDVLFQDVCEDQEAYHLTRLDVAYDDHGGLLDIGQLRADTDELQVVTKWRRVSSEWSYEFDTGLVGICLNYGSPASDCKLRIYDKAAERGYAGRHWIRVELQLRDDRALAFAQAGGDLGTRFCGVLRNYIRFVEDPGTDRNMWRWPMRPYWERFLNGVQAVRLWDTPGVDYNLSKLEDYVLGQAGAAVLTYLDIVGLEEFVRKLRPCGAKRSAKYRQLLASLGSKCYYEDISRRMDEQDWLCRVKSLIQGGGPGGIHPTQQNKNIFDAKIFPQQMKIEGPSRAGHLRNGPFCLLFFLCKIGAEIA